MALSPGLPKLPPPAINIPVGSIDPPADVIEDTFNVNVISINEPGAAGQLPSDSQLPKQCLIVVSPATTGKSLSL